MSKNNGHIPMTTPEEYAGLSDLDVRRIHAAADEVITRREAFNGTAKQINAHNTQEDPPRMLQPQRSSTISSQQIQILVKSLGLNPNRRYNYLDVIELLDRHVKIAVEGALKEQTERTLAIFEKVAVFVDKENKIFNIFQRIEEAASNVNRQQGRENLIRFQTSEKLLGAFGAHTEAARTFEVLKERTAAIGEKVRQYAEGVQRFVTGGDTGEYLLEQIRIYGNQEALTLLEVREIIAIGGRPIEEHRVHLVEEYQEMRKHHTKIKARTFVVTAIGKYKAMPEAKDEKSWQYQALMDLEAALKDPTRWVQKLRRTGEKLGTL